MSDPDIRLLPSRRPGFPVHMNEVPLPPEVIDAGPLRLGRVRTADAEELAAAVQASLDHLRPWMEWAGPQVAEVDSQRQRIAEAEQRWPEGDHRYLMRTADGAVVGGCGLHRRVGPGGIEIGYWVHVDHTGRGYATAAARALTEAGLALPDIGRVEIRCDVANVRSQAVPMRLGYRLDRIERRESAAPAEVGQDMVWVMNIGA